MAKELTTKRHVSAASSAQWELGISMEMKLEREEEEEVHTSENKEKEASGFEPATSGLTDQLLLPLIPDRATSAMARASEREGGSQQEKRPEEPKITSSTSTSSSTSSSSSSSPSSSTSLRRIACIARHVACAHLDQRGNARKSFPPAPATWQREERGLKQEEGSEEWTRTTTNSTSTSTSTSTSLRRMECICCIARHVACAQHHQDERGGNAAARTSSPDCASTSSSLRRMECIARHVACAQQQDERGGNAAWTSSPADADRATRRRATRVQDAESQGMRFAPEVRDALLRGKAVVALESTIISHGMPYPDNLRTAMEVEEIVRLAGAVPATIAIMAGIPKIGLSASDLRELAKLGKSSVQKTSRRDIAQVVAERRNGATTVSGTMVFAAAAGISIFVTGGIGGVHRGAETSMDISADLTELGRTPVTVVCAGVKSILDIPKTLEWLETQGVTVVGYGTDEFPAFFTVSSGCQAPCRMDKPESCAALIAANRKMNLGSGILIGVPIPAKDAAVGERVEVAIKQALEESRGKVEGSAVTPFLLKRVNELTHGESLAANVALVKNNALVGAKIAVALQSLL